MSNNIEDTKSPVQDLKKASNKQISPLKFTNPRSGSNYSIKVPTPKKKLQLDDNNNNNEDEKEGLIKLPNHRISRDIDDVLYHLGLSSKFPLEEMFSDTKFVIMGGSSERAKTVAHLVAKRLNVNVPVGMNLCPIGKTERFSLYKVGPVISVNHGMGMPSMSILLHEITKLLYHAKATNVIYIRCGTSGGLGIPAGTVVAATHGCNEKFEPQYEQYILGKLRSFDASFDNELAELAFSLAEENEDYGLEKVNCVLGRTMGTCDFYEGQGRVDGSCCDYTEDERKEWIQAAYDSGIRNIEMEAPLFASFCNRVNVKAILLNTVLLNRLEGDQVTATPEELKGMSANAQEVAVRVVIHKLLQYQENDDIFQ